MTCRRFTVVTRSWTPISLLFYFKKWECIKVFSFPQGCFHYSSPLFIFCSFVVVVFEFVQINSPVLTTFPSKDKMSFTDFFGETIPWTSLTLSTDTSTPFLSQDPSLSSTTVPRPRPRTTSTSSRTLRPLPPLTPPHLIQSLLLCLRGVRCVSTLPFLTLTVRLPLPFAKLPKLVLSLYWTEQEFPMSLICHTSFPSSSLRVSRRERPQVWSTLHWHSRPHPCSPT